MINLFFQIVRCKLLAIIFFVAWLLMFQFLLFVGKVSHQVICGLNAGESLSTGNERLLMLMYKTDEPCWISNLRYHNFLTNFFALVRNWTNALCFDVISSNDCKYFHRSKVLPSLMHYITH